MTVHTQTWEIVRRWDDHVQAMPGDDADSAVRAAVDDAFGEDGSWVTVQPMEMLPQEKRRLPMPDEEPRVPVEGR